jgi:type II secretory pathway pseudopilin PulG
LFLYPGLWAITVKTIISQSFPRAKCARIRAFSLVEVVFALAICTFVLVGVMGLFLTGVQANRESEEEIQAANLASLIISSARATPLGPNASSANSPIPAAALTNVFAPAYENKYVGWDGTLLNSASNAAYSITCRAGTNTLTGTGLSQVYLMLSWPVQANPANNPPHYYEVSTYIPFP